MGLSGDWRELQKRGDYDVVIIGSGYGAGVMAARLPATKRSICILERGREYAPTDFPTHGWAVRKATQLTLPHHKLGSPLGLFDLRVDTDLSVLVGCGLGGTSLINAGVSIKPSRRVFELDVWPRALRAQPGDSKHVLDEHYTTAHAMLRPAATPTLYGKAKQLRDAAELSGYKRFEQAAVNVNFASGAGQAACNGCGNCVTGCVTGAKNTLCQTYLPVAQRAGVAIYTQCAARWIERRREGGYIVHYQRIADDGSTTDGRVTARTVVLGAGTFGSTEILLRSREHGLRLSRGVGERFSGNGDIMALGYDYTTQIDSVGFGRTAKGSPIGPTISAIVDLRSDDPASPLTDSMIIEEGAFPGSLATLLRYLMEVLAVTAVGPSHLPVGLRVQMWFRELLDLIGFDLRAGALNHTQMFFAIGHDDSGGRLVLDGDRVHVAWPTIGDLPAYQSAMAVLGKLVDTGGGQLIDYPFYRRYGHSKMLSAHPLGGCVMADNADHGVVDANGQVFDGDGGVHDGLYVVDGSIVPSSLGVNPLWTITALGEWIAKAAVARLSAN